MEASTLQLVDSSGEGRGLVDNSTAALSQANGGIQEGAGLEKTLPLTQSDKKTEAVNERWFVLEAAVLTPMADDFHASTV
ncbi:hypothetical protein NDU88_000173 [Pleurodeles waltl]|uniref:Uncharacterized protein n=1 Tax=Pleurodeles waltl TaxID=8319 RepID=A0AAV7P4Y6_PLEWA|nr:hypothetical protein NDU88_000173 [Pleurodeles waltl]